MHPQFPNQPQRAPLHEYLAVVGLALLLHLAVYMAGYLQPEMPTVRVSELSVSFANMQRAQADVMPQPRHKLIEPEAQTVEAAAVKQDVQPAQPDVTPTAPVMLDAEPDYRADYLNNPRPPYPMAARRMGYHGKVVLNVEVLAEGKAGQVLLHQSSGYEILDNAAIQTVKSWNFTPARRFGQPVTQWFLVPIKFSLEDNET